MKPEEIDAYLKQKDYVSDDFKIEWDAFRFMIGGKMFAMRGQNKEGIPILTVKLTPQECALYCEEVEHILPGYYMNKVHWISVFYEKVEDELVRELMDKAYHCGFCALTKKKQKELLEA